MNSTKKTIIVTILIAGFIFGVSFSTLYAQTHIVEGTACGCTLPIPLLIPTFSSLGVFVGSIVYYILSGKIMEQRMKTVKHKERYESNLKTVLSMMDNNERKIIERLVNNKGNILQSKLSKEFGKVKTFRIIETLKKRGIVEKERHGKTNLIKLTEKFSLLSS